MKEKSKRRWIPLIGAMVLLLPVSASQAQDGETRTVVIENGRVLVDGRLLPSEAIPPDFQPGGMTATMQFSGHVQPVFQVNESIYRLEGDRLVRVDAAPSLFLAGPEASLNRAREMMDGHREEFLEFQRQHRDGVQGFEPGKFEQFARAARELNAELRQVAAPGYFYALAQRDQDLVGRLAEEQRMEAESRRLAVAIRSERNRAQRDAMTEQLRDHLSEIFELKQENRRSEIDQLEERLAELHERLGERERMKERIIERRLLELIDRTSTAEW